MAPRDNRTHRSGMRRPLDKALLGGVSLLALMIVSDLGEARSLTPGANSVAPTAAAQQAAIAAAQQSAGAATQAQASLARAAAALASASKLQQDAAAAARALASSVPNGLTPGGLMPAGGTANDPLAGILADSSKWTGANLPVQTASGADTRVDINQTQQKAILYWDTFNVGARTTVNFNQSASTWIALNRVQDPSAAPSQILGQINAPGSVYLINRNGIIFGAGSQVNVHSLVASSLDIGQLGTDLTARDQYFLNTGIANLNSFSIYDENAGAKTGLVAGDIKVERGASINAKIAADVSELDSPGSVYLFGANIRNSGSITAPKGEVGMVAARTIDLVPHGYSVLPDAVLGTDDKGDKLPIRGTEFRISQFASAYDASGHPIGAYLSGTGMVSHDGLIEASRGTVVMNGDRISIDNPTDAGGNALKDATGNLIQGVISVDTSIDRNSIVLLRAATSVTMNGVISSLPFDDGTPPLASGGSDSTIQSFTPAYVELSAQSSVTVGTSGLISAPSAQVVIRAIDLGSQNAATLYKKTGTGSTNEAIYENRLFNQGGSADVASSTPSAPQTVLLMPGATIDVAGLQNVELPASYNFISFQPTKEFADMPLQRAGALYGKTLWIDIRTSGTRSDGTTWVGTPLADASGYVNAVGRSIYQLMTVGGSVDLRTDLTTNGGGAGIQTAGSVINMAGGSVTFLPGMVNTTRLVGADGRIYNIANADPNMTYLGIAGQFSVNHARWNVTETWSTGTQIYSPGYTEGHNAGAISFTTVTPSLSGTMYFGSVAGERQINAGTLPLQGSLTLTTPSSVEIGSTPSANYTTHGVVTTLSADTLSGYGLSTLSITANDLVVSSDSALNLAAGGKFSATAGGAIDIAGEVYAAGGTINLVTDRAGQKFSTSLFEAPKDQSGNVIAANVFVEGTLDVSGRFVNDTGRTGADVSGPAFINGGSISITTNKDSNAKSDTTGSILLAKSSILDVSSGGYVSSQGKAKTTSTGVMAGKAGSISLAIYQGKNWNDQTGPVTPDPAISRVAVLQLDGKLLGYGFESNGSLRLAGADTVRIGGALQSGETSSIRVGGIATTLPESLLNGGGFGAFIIESVADDWSGARSEITVSAGASLDLRQQNFSSNIDYKNLATGSRLARQGTALELLGDDQRKAVDLTLRADHILLDTGATILTDPKANITLGGIAADHTLATSSPIRNVPAQSVELLGSIIDHGGAVFVNAQKTHLGSQAVVDLSGTFVANSRFGARNGPPTSGTYLAGGTFSVEGGTITKIIVAKDTTDSNKDIYYYTYLKPNVGYLVSDIGAMVDVSGAAGTVEVAGARGATTSLWSWSDAGRVSADVTGYAWGGSFAATGGRYRSTDGIAHADSRANNGTFILGGGAISLGQDNTDVISHLASPQSIYISANQLAPFDNIYLYSAAAVGGAARFFDELPAYNRLAASNVVAETYEVAGSTFNLPEKALAASDNTVFNSLTISGSLDLHIENGLRIAASTIASNTANSTVAIDAPYVLFTSAGGTTTSGSSTFNVRAQTIDVAGANFSGFAAVNLISSGDIRLNTRKISNTIDATTGASTYPNSFSGKLVTEGDLLLQAQRIYPVSAVDFTIQTPGNVTFAAPAGSQTGIPLSAGGSLTVFAKNIVQGGNLFAPLGKITLGNTDSAVNSITTQSVVLAPGSLTSVTLADTVVPYGATSDGTNWYYNSTLDPLSQPPSKGIVMAGVKVERSDGSTIDLRGGGDVQAMEWIQGKGGSRDTLTTTPSGQAVYALVPSNNDALSAIDIHFTAAHSVDIGKIAGDAYPMAGTQITIDGGNGIPAGTYTLYPAHYATLPGAIRVVYYGDNIGRNVPTGTSLADGTVLVTGHTTQSTTPGKQSSGQSLFAVQSSDVWQQYSEYSFSRANSYFTQLAAKKGQAVPRLPMDAGRLAVSALQSIVLNGIALTQPGRDTDGNIGRGGELDITAPQLAIVGQAGYASNDIPTGYVGLDVSQLIGFESILIGGLRSDTVTGTLITPVSNNVLVDTRGDAFTGPEILLVATAKPGALQTILQTVTVNGQTIAVEDQVYVPAADSGTVKIASGSVIRTTGTVHAGAGRNYYFADPTADFAGTDHTASTAKDIAAALGGTLDASGTVITGADISKFTYVVQNADGSVKTNPDGSFYRHTGSLSAADLNKLQNYAYQTKGLNALFVASNDSSLNISVPTKLAPPSLTIQFAASTDSNAPGPTNGALVLPDAGRVVIDAGANITTKALTVYATATTNSIVGNSSDIHAQQLNVAARSIGLGSPSLVTDKSLALYNQQFADLQALSLKALSGVITVYGDFNPGVATSLTLDAAAVVRAGNGGDAHVTVNGSDSSITLINTGTASAPTSSPASSDGFKLSFDASDIVLGGGAQSLLGYGHVDLDAADRVFVAGPGSLTLGTVSDVVQLAVATPNILVGGATSTNGGSFAISTHGGIIVSTLSPHDGVATRPADSAETGGNLSLTGAGIVVDSTIQAQAGTIMLDATTGSVVLAQHGYLAAGGYKKTLVDVDTYLSGGKVVLKADAADVYTDPLSVIDVAQPDGGQGYGGAIEVTALGGNATLAGALRGGGGPGLGGSFKLDIKGAADLSALADQLVAGGVTGAIDIHTRTGNLELLQGHTLKANAVTLTADDPTWPNILFPSLPESGKIYIAGTIDADGYAGRTGDGTGQAGGSVGLFGHNAVVLAPSGKILARTGGSDVVLEPAGTTSFVLPSTIVWFGGGTGTDTVRFSVGGRFTTDGGVTYTFFAANDAIALPANSAVVLDAPGTVALSGGSSPIHIYAPAHDDERGGDVTIGTAWSAGGNIDLQAGSQIDVSGGIKGGLLGGTVTLRAPLDGNDNVKIAGLDATISGARAVNVQAFLAIDTQASPNNQNGIDGSKLTTKGGTKVVWDGYIDPAGSTDASGALIDYGPWTNVTGEKLNVTPGVGYIAPPNISVVTSAGAKIDGVPVIDPATGATLYEVTDPVTGTTFRSSLQVTSISINSGGTYTSTPTVTVTAANGKDPLGKAVATAVMKYNSISFTGVPLDDSLNNRVVTLLDGAGKVLATGNIVVSGGMLIRVNVSSTTSVGTIASLRFGGFGNKPPDIIADFSAVTLSVAAVTIVSGGSGYVGGVNVSFSSGLATATATMGATVSITGVTKGFTGANNPTLIITGTGTGAAATFSPLLTTGLSGTTGNDHVFVPSVGSDFVPLAGSKVFNGTQDSATLTITPNQQHQLLYSEVLSDFIQGNGIQGVGLTGSYGFSGVFTKTQSLVDQLGASVVHVQPGIDLVNSSTSINGGNITVSSNWNLAAGTAKNTITGSNGQTYFDPATSYVDFTYRLTKAPWGGIEAPVLTLRAAANINVNASISDGFFQFRNYLDPGYVAAVTAATGRTIDSVGGAYTYYLNNVGGVVAIAPYNDAGNGISPTSQDLAVADLFPHTLRVCTNDCSSVKPVTAPSSSSYTMTAGADVSSANPTARIPLSQATGSGDVIVDKHSSYSQSLVNDKGLAGSTQAPVTVYLPTMVRTGTGNITIASARDVILNDTVAPGVIYAAGVNTAKLTDPNYSLQTVNGVSGVVAGYSGDDAFFEPLVLAYGNAAVVNGASDLYYGPPTAAAFPEKGGDVRIDAQRDIVGYSGSGNKVLQYYQPWLLSDAGVTPASDAQSGTSVKPYGAGVFAPSGTQIASQTAWWIQYGSFQQGFLSAGGNVTVVAGRDLVDVSVSLPTTGRVSGGLTANSTPVTHLYDSGNMIVRAGRNLLGGSFYEGSGHASIVAGASIGQNGTVSRFDGSKLPLPDVPVLAVDTGQIEMVAGGAIAMAGVVNPAELHAQAPNFANPLEATGTAALPLYMDTYGPDSKVRLVAKKGDVTIRIAPTAITDKSGSGALLGAAAIYPASFEALALNGSLITTGISEITRTDIVTGLKGSSISMPGIVLSASEHGTFDLLAQGSIDLTFGYPKNTTALLNGTPRPFISAGSALIESAFDPYQPANGFGGAFSGAVLAHQDDESAGIDATARIYAATGDITATGSFGKLDPSSTTQQKAYQQITINRPTKVYAGHDIIDLNIIVQNIHASDVSTIEAGRNISYTGYNNGGGLQVAGPGFFVVQAGGDIGPFLPAAHDNPAEALVQEGIASVGNSSPTPVGNGFVSGSSAGGGSVGIYDQALLGPESNPRRNALLTQVAGTARGADIVTLFGTKFGVDYQSVVNVYIDPANAGNVSHNYLGELQDFLAKVGKPASAVDAAALFGAFKALPTDLQHVFVDQVFFAELKSVAVGEQGGAGQFQRGYEMINTMFPSSLGYTANALDGGSNGANKLVKTGDLNLLHATIQTQLGGEVSIFGPGGNLIVGSLATESNRSLKLRDLGILTLGGGSINTFTDESVLVNSSRVLTTQGGDVLMWSSNADLDAGRGSKTTLSAPALQVQFDQDDYQTVDLGGFVSGAGIGILQASKVAKKSNLYLLAPRGIIDAGTAGIRVSGDAVFVAPVIANAGNIQVQGSTSGIPVISIPSIGALTAGSNAAGAATKSADVPTGAGSRGEQASIFMVEVIGYGGGDGQGQPATGNEPSSDAKPSDKRKQ